MAEQNNNGHPEWAPPIDQMSRNDLNNSECSICLNPLYVASDDIPVPDPTEINNCHHRFHRQCLVGSCGANLVNCRCPTCQENFNCNDAGLTDLRPQVEARFAVLDAPPPPEPEPEPAAAAAPQIDVAGLIDRVNQLARVCYDQIRLVIQAERRPSGEQYRILMDINKVTNNLVTASNNLRQARTLVETRTNSLQLLQVSQQLSSMLNRVDGPNLNYTPAQRGNLQAIRDASIEIPTLAGQVLMSTMPKIHEPEIDIAPIQEVIISDPEIRRIAEQLATFINNNTASKRQEILQTLSYRSPFQPTAGVNNLNHPPLFRSRDGKIPTEYILDFIGYYIRQLLISRHAFETLQPPANYTAESVRDILRVITTYESNNPQTTIDSLQDIMRDGLGARYQHAQQLDGNNQQGYFMPQTDYNANKKRVLHSLQIQGRSLANFFNQMYRLMLENYGGNMPVNNQGAVAMRRVPQQPRTLRDYFQLILDLFTRIQYLINENQFHGGKKERKSKRKTRRNRRKTRKNKRKTRRNRK